MTDGASRRQAFCMVVLPQVRIGMLAIAVFAFLRGWEEYVFVRTLLFQKTNWTMSLYLFWMRDDVMGTDYAMVSAMGVFYVLPSVVLYTCHTEIPDADDHRRDQGLSDGGIELARRRQAFGSEVIAVEPPTSTIDDGEFVAILGPSGCGKSTTLFMLAGIYAPSGGDILFDGARRQRGRGARPQRRHRLPVLCALSAHDACATTSSFPLRFKKIAARRGACAGVEGRGQARPGRGTARAAARRNVGRPAAARRARPRPGQGAAAPAARRAALEPRRDAAADDAQRDPSLQRKLGVTTILVTHDQIEATTMADRVICMSKGRIEQIGTAGRPLPPAGQPVRRQLHRLAADQPARGIGCCRAPHDRRRRACNWRGRRAARWCSA